MYPTRRGERSAQFSKIKVRDHFGSRFVVRPGLSPRIGISGLIAAQDRRTVRCAHSDRADAKLGWAAVKCVFIRVEEIRDAQVVALAEKIGLAGFVFAQVALVGGQRRWAEEKRG